MVGLVTSMLFVANVGGAIGSPGIESLFYARFGVQYLPVMYILLGVVSPITSILMTVVLDKFPEERVYRLIPLIMASLLIVARFLLIFDFRWFYPVLWLGMVIYWLLESLYAWGIASLACDTRQAKRLFPLFAVGRIAGLAIGSLLTGLLVAIVGSENLILIWALGLFAAFLLAQRILTSQKIHSRIRRRRKSSTLAGLKDGFNYVRSSSLLKWMSLSAVLFAVLFLALVFPYATAVTEQFQDEAEVAAFLGTFYGIATAAAILVSLFVANRLYARFGFMSMILIYPIIYLLGFSIAAIQSSFLILVVFRFAQVFWAEGVSEGANQAMYNVIPQVQREKSRTFIRGIANQLGISLAGIILLLSDRFLPANSMFLIGIGAAIPTVYFVYRASRAYGSAVVAALRAGQTSIFFGDEQPFGGLRQDATAVETLVRALDSSDIITRRTAAEILGQLTLPEAIDAIIAHLDDPDAKVRAGLVRGLRQTQAAPAILEVAALLKDPDPEVRLQAVKTLPSLTPYRQGLIGYIQPLLDDPDPAVRTQAAANLLKVGPHQAAVNLLNEMTSARGDTGPELANRILALEALVDWGSQEAYEQAASGLVDPNPAIRRISALIMAQIDAQQCLMPLKVALGDPDKQVREGVALAIGQVGLPALDIVVEALESPSLEDGALLALHHLPARRAATQIKAFAFKKADQAVQYHLLWQACSGYLNYQRQNQIQETQAQTGDLHLKATLLADALLGKARLYGVRALDAMGLIGDPESTSLAINNLDSELTSQRANAAETLDSIGDPKIVKKVLPLWENTQQIAPNPDEAWLMEVLSDPDPWLRACGVFVLNSQDHCQRLKESAEKDPDPLVRATAQLQLNGAQKMETVETLSTMERILFLRKVGLFADLPPDDLRQIAIIADEQLFEHGTTVAHQGDLGNEMYIIISGEIIISTTNEADQMHEISRRQPGDYVGEMAIISDEVRMASMTAQGNVRTLSIDQVQFKEILRTRPETSLAVMKELCARLRELS